VGPGGHFLAQEHTLEHMRQELYLPSLAVRQNYTAWEKGGRKNMVDHARAEVARILSEHRPLPLPEGLEKELQARFPKLLCK
jgi:trimethylamine--corrinoid protein Co-methyltransferase